mmetsp:Transcript_37760/g.99851  ORF Transcript_37760/g.99851 Transcript_37760/m.99851 type:complete len:222 (+) Transcript_37760:61-726(+)
MAMPRFLRLLAMLATTAKCVNGREVLMPTAFPPAATYTAHLVTTNASKLCSLCTFDGRHYYNSNPDKLYGHVAWVYGPSDKSEPYVNFIDIFLGHRREMYLITDEGGGSAHCNRIAPYLADIFNASWANGASYLGVQWFHGRLCHVWDGVYPYFIQGEVAASTYFEDAFTRLPAGYVNMFESFWYDADTFVIRPEPDDEMFTSVLNLNCSAAPPTRVSAWP